MKHVLLIIGIVLIAISAYYAWQLGEQGVHLIGYINGVKVVAVTHNESILIDTLTGKNPTIEKVIVDVPEGKNVIIKQGNTTETFGPGQHVFTPQPKPVPVEIIVDNKTGVIYLAKDGALLGASFEGGLSLSVLSVSGGDVDQLKTAVLTYTVAPFMSGVFFTVASLLVKRQARGSSRRVW